MCLKVDLDQKVNKRKTTVYKRVIYIGGGIFQTPYQYKNIKGGWFKTEEPHIKSKDVYDRQLIHGGAIHAYAKHSDAKERVNFLGGFLLKCKVNPKDFIAYGTNKDIAYSKIFIPKSELDKVRKQAKEIHGY